MINRVDRRAKQKGYLIYKSDELYVKQLTRDAEIYIQRNGEDFMAYRLTFRNGDPKPVSERTIVRSTDITNAFKSADSYIKRYMQYINKLKNSI